MQLLLLPCLSSDLQKFQKVQLATTNYYSLVMVDGNSVNYDSLMADQNRHRSGTKTGLHDKPDDIRSFSIGSCTLGGSTSQETTRIGVAATDLGGNSGSVSDASRGAGAQALEMIIR